MAVDPAFGKRARVALAEMDEPLEVKVIAERVRALAKRATLTPQAVGGWFRGQEPESFELLKAFATVLQVDPGYLAFGDSGTLHSEKPNVTPDQPDIIDRSDYAGVEPGTAKRVAEAKKPAVKRAAGGKGKR